MNLTTDKRELELHLNVVGSFLERLPQYRTPKLDTAKELVRSVLAELAPTPATAKDIARVLTVQGVPLVSQVVLREAAKALEDDGVITNGGHGFALTQPSTVPRRTKLPPDAPAPRRKRDGESTLQHPWQLSPGVP